jgi:hypothetical protein
VIANATDAVSEELSFFLRHRTDALWACDLVDGRPVDARLLGELDEVQRITFERVLELRSASAPALAAERKGEIGVGATAWNNRLSNLAARGLLIERRGGKTKTFTPVLETN